MSSTQLSIASYEPDSAAVAEPPPAPDLGSRNGSRRARRLLATVEQVSGIGHWYLDLVVQGLEWSDQVYRIHGFEPRAFLPTLERATAACHPEDRHRVSALMRGAVREQRGETFEMRIFNAAGGVRTVLCNAEPDFDERGQVLGLLGTFQDITEQKRAQRQLEEQARRLQEEVDRRSALEEELRRLALTDELTGVPNRRHFMNHASNELARSERYRRALSVIAFDLDRFKRINDTWGHAVGDRAIRQVASQINGMLRSSSDLLGRLGGEEFAVVLAETEAGAASELAQRMRRSVQERRLEIDGTHISVTCSFGVTQAQPGETDIDEVLARADAAVYEAKSTGRNRVCCG